MIECKKFLTMERVKVHRELIQDLKAFTYNNEWHKGANVCSLFACAWGTVYY